MSCRSKSTMASLVTATTAFATSFMTTAFSNFIDLNVPFYMRNLYIMVGAMGSVGNLFVFSILFKYLSLYPSLTEILLLHQSIIDGITAIIVIFTAVFPPPIDYSDSPSILEDFLCRFWATQVNYTERFVELDK